MTENEVKAIRWMKCVKDDAVRRKEMPMNKTKSNGATAHGIRLLGVCMPANIVMREGLRSGSAAGAPEA